MPKHQDSQPLMKGRQIDSSYLKLKWEIQNIQGKTQVMQKELSNKLNEIPIKNTREINKIQNWLKQINEVIQKMENITDIQIKELEKRLHYKFTTPELVILALFQPSMNKFFHELKIFFTRSNIDSIKSNEFDDFINMSDAAKALALIGDAVIDLAVVQIFWVPKISKVGDLHDQRASLVSNEHLATLCDKWNLFDYRIHQDPPQPIKTEKTLNHTKATIVESLFGIIYVESGLEGVISTITVLK